MLFDLLTTATYSGKIKSRLVLDRPRIIHTLESHRRDSGHGTIIMYRYKQCLAILEKETGIYADENDIIQGLLHILKQEQAIVKICDPPSEREKRFMTLLTVDGKLKSRSCCDIVDQIWNTGIVLDLDINPDKFQLIVTYYGDPAKIYNAVDPDYRSLIVAIWQSIMQCY